MEIPQSRYSESVRSMEISHDWQVGNEEKDWLFGVYMGIILRTQFHEDYDMPSKRFFSWLKSNIFRSSIVAFYSYKKENNEVLGSGIPMRKWSFRSYQTEISSNIYIYIHIYRCIYIYIYVYEHIAKIRYLYIYTSNHHVWISSSIPPQKNVIIYVHFISAHGTVFSFRSQHTYSIIHMCIFSTLLHE